MTDIEWSRRRKIPPWKPLLFAAAVLMLVAAACGTAASQQGSANKVEVVPVDSGKSVVVAPAQPAAPAAQVQVPAGSQVQVVPAPPSGAQVQVVPAQPAPAQVQIVPVPQPTSVVQVQVVPAAPADQPPTAPGRDAVPVAASAPDGTASGDTQAGAAFARWVMDQDPQQKLITAAVVRNDTNLSVKVNATATKTDVQNLLVALAQGMARTFPGKPITVDGYYQSGDKLATATYDPLNKQVAVQWLH
ncbi:MAG: hypothetical protein U0641_05560 [Anaerolineae bacterium]